MADTNSRASEQITSNLRNEISRLKEENTLLRKELYSARLQQEKYQDQLLENKARFEILPEKLNDVIVIRNLEGKYTYVSPSIKKYGYDPQNVLGKSAQDFIVKEDLPKVHEAVEKIMKEPGSSTTIKSLQVILANGRIGSAEISLTNLLHQRGVNGIVVNIRDISDRVKFEDKLKESEEKYRALFENATDGIALLEDYKVIFCNERFLTLFNAGITQVIGRSVLPFFAQYNPDDPEVIAEQNKMLKRLKSGKSVSYEVKLRNTDQKEFDAEVTFNSVKLSSGQHTMMIVHDLSDLHKAYQKIQENEIRLRNIFESMKDGVYLVGSDYSIMYINEAMIRQTGAIPDRMSCYKQIYGFGEPCKWCIAEELKLGQSQTEEMYNPKTNKYYSTTTTLINVEGEDCLMHISRDVTEVKLAQEKISQSEEKFRNIFNHSNDAIFITDSEGNYLEVNDKAAHRSGYSKKEFRKMNFVDLTDFSSSNNTREYLQKVMTDGQATSEFFYENTQGKGFLTEVNSRLINFQGKAAILHVSRDITLRKELERQVLEATIKTEENERSRFARDLHDGIGPYLSAAKYMLLALDRETDPQEQKRIVERAGQSIDEIIRNVKEISNNISPHVLQNFGLNAALNSFRKKIRPDQIYIEIFSNTDEKRFDENLEITVFRIVTELLNNTIKYAKAQRATISLMLSGKDLHVRYEHDGKGFDYQYIRKNTRGSGLKNIETRVNALQGKCKFITSPHSGLNFEAYFKEAITII